MQSLYGVENAGQVNFHLNPNLPALNRLEALIQLKTGNTLNSLQKIILFKSLCEPNQTYEEIAEEVQYSVSYIKRFVAPNLWQLLSTVLETKISKLNCRQQLETVLIQSDDLPNLPEFPVGSVPLNSAYYIEHFSLEQMGCAGILNPGNLILIKATQHMGKTSLVERIIHRGKQQNYHRVYLTLKLVDRELLNSGTQFFRWLCANISQQLCLPAQLDRYWDEDRGSVINCTGYFQSYILPALDRPLVLAIEDIDQLLEHSFLNRDFLSMIHCWFEKVQHHDSSAWQKLRLILSYSTDIYGVLGVHRSPVNMGLCLELQPFSVLQVFDLSQRHGLNLSEKQLNQVMELCGGFTYLVRRLFYEQVSSQVSWEELIETAATNWGIFSDYLQEKLELLEQNETLIESYRNVLNAEEPIQLPWKQALQLKNLGLVDGEKGKVKVSSGLYRQYFREHLK